MHQPIEVIPLEAETVAHGGAGELPGPGVVGDEGVGVVRTDLVKHEEGEDPRIRQIREAQAAIRPDQERDDGEDEEILEESVLPIVRRDPEHDEPDAEERQERRGIAVASGHGVVSSAVRSAAASAASSARTGPIWRQRSTPSRSIR